ncbi:hypothetical protein FGB62_40g29 [Gracilaria domingensis]|nr:hypothetical protein FGB62_40g29 [Gracilaria domingensis]
MGRADLASHRSSWPSDTKPVAFPKRAAWVLDHILRVPNVNIASTISTIRDATTQKAQVSALKLLGVQLRDAHTINNSSGQMLCACMTKSANSNAVYFCRMAGSVFTGVLFESPDATAGLVSTALRAVLKCPVRLDEVQKAFTQVFQRLEDAASPSASSDSLIPFSTLVTDMCFISVTVADPHNKGWVFDQETRIRGSLSTVNDVIQIYLQVTMSDEMQTMNLLSNTAESSSLLSQRLQSANENKRLLENASDFALKAAQDLLSGLRKSHLENASTSFSIEVIPIVKNLVGSCKELLLLSTIPRNCALACSITYVTGLLILGAEDSAEQVSSLLKRKVFVELPQFPHFSRLSLLRAIMETSAARVAHPLILFPRDDQIWSTGDSCTVFERLVLMTKENGDAHLRYLAMDALVKCVRRRHPLKLGIQLRKAAVMVIKGRWNETFPGTTLQMKEAIEALIAVDGNDAEAKAFWEDMAFALVKGSWYHRGIYAPLNILVARVGAMRLLQCEPRCQDKAIEAACADSRLTKPAAEWLGAFWNALRSECKNSGTNFADLACDSLLLSLTDASRKSRREVVAEHILPVYFQRLDKALVEVHAKALLERLERLNIDSPRQTGAVVTIMSVARNRGVFVGSFAEPGTLRLITDALMSADDEMRSTTFELVVTSRAPTEPIRQEELDLVLMYLPLALTYSASLSHRSRFRHGMRRFFERFAACQKAASDGCGGWWTRERKEKHNGVRTASFENMREMLVDRLVRFETACFKILLANVYPGASFGRRMNAFELMILMSENLGLRRFLSSPQSYGGVLAGISVGLLDEWERTRRSALRVLLSLPDIPPGLQTLSEAAAIQEASIPLLQSPRLRDVDSGASIIRFVYKKLVLPMAISVKETDSFSEVKCFSFPNGLGAKPLLESDVPSLYYAKTILNSLEETLNLSRANFSEACESGLFHSRFRILRQVLKDYNWKELFGTDNLKSTSSLVSKIIDLAWSCTLVALKGVSFEALTTFSGFAAGDEMMEGEHIFLHERKQLEMTTCFLSLKEICVTLGILSYEVSLEGVSSTSGEPRLISSEDVTRIGDLFLHVFANTRHWGVIDGAAEGFQLLCERLLLTSCSALRSLPKIWSTKMIHDALGGNMYVLRRSAGVPALVNAVVNSEVNSDSRSLHAPLLEGIVTYLSKHLEQSHMFIDPAKVASNRSKEEEGVSHALNMLRSLFLNTKIAKRILKYFEKTVILCVKAFCSASWLIRNSATMLFSALVRRGIGVCIKNEAISPPSLSSFSARTGTSATLLGPRRIQGVTPVQFFSRYPNLHPFLRNQLQLSVQHAEKGQETDYPSLFPTLYLLSSLSPGAPEDPATTVSMKPFREVLRKCSHWHSDYIRRVGASACVLLVEDHFSTAEFLKDLTISAIPINPILAKADTEEYLYDIHRRERRSRGHDEYAQILRQNHLHGDLLTVEAILQGIGRGLDIQYMKDIVQMFADCIPKRVWVASDKNPCSYTRAAMVRVISIIYRMACKIIDDPKASDAFPFCTSFINLCHKLDDTLRREEPSVTLKESLIGTPALRKASSALSRLRITRNAQKAKQHPHLPSLQLALFDIEATVLTEDPELKMIGFDNSRFLLKVYIVDSNGREMVKSLSNEVTALLLNIWNHAKHCCKTAEDEELLISALKLQSTLFDLARQHGSSNILRKHYWTEKELERIVELSRYHPCIDAREQTLILLGQAVSANPSWVRLSSAWMQGLEIAVSSSSSSSRIAVCTSLAASRMEVSQTCAELSQKFGARGYLLWTKLLQDDNADVVSHALKTVQAYLWEQQSVTKSVLPTLTEIFRRLAEQHKTSPALFHFTEMLLAGNTQAEQRSRRLFTLLGMLTGQQTKHAEVECPKQKMLDAEKSQNTRLFELEESSFRGERVMCMQFVARCYSHILSTMPTSNRCRTEDAENLIEDLFGEVRMALDCATQSINAGLFGSKSFSSPGFETCYASILRTFLGIRCVQMTSRNKKSIALRKMAGDLRVEIRRWKSSLHPVLTMAMNGLCALVDGNRGPWGAEAISQILFLL